jgi:hypothetical protein
MPANQVRRPITSSNSSIQRCATRLTERWDVLPSARASADTIEKVD